MAPLARAARMAAIFFLFAFGFAPPARAYVLTLSSSGTTVKWPESPAKLNLAGNPVNQSGLSDSDVYSAVVRGLRRWQSAGSGALSFDYWQGRDPSIYIPNSNYNGLNSLYFASNATGPTGLSPGILGLTQVWYDTSNGRLLEADVVLNDLDFNFTTNPQDTSGFGSASSGGSSGGKADVFIENVITHELGHAFGLAHSGGLQSTMLFVESPEQAHLGCDEQVGIHALYPASDAPIRGSIEGRVLAPFGAPVVGAHVQAISRRRGTALASALTDRSGHYRIDALEPGDYFLLIEPFFAGARALPSYYSAASPYFCPGNRAFSREIFSDSQSGRPQSVSVQSGAAAGVPDITVACGNGGALVSGNASPTLGTSAPQIYGGIDAGFGAMDSFPSPIGSGASAYYLLHSVQGKLEVHALAYSLYSPIRAMLKLLDMNGVEVPSSTSTNPVYSGDSGYQNFDSSLEASVLPLGDYYLQVSGSALEMELYPAGEISEDLTPFFLITGSVNELSELPLSTLPANPRCRMDENFPAYQSPAGNPPQISVNGGGGSGACGTLQAREGREEQKGAIFGWLLPWLCMLAMIRLAKPRRDGYL